LQAGNPEFRLAGPSLPPSNVGFGSARGPACGSKIPRNKEARTMKPVQFSIVMLLGAVTLAALGCAALVNASPVTAAVMVTATVLVWLGTIVGAVYSRSSRRPAYGGFAIFAGVYLLLTGPLFEGVGPYLLTRVANDAAYQALVEAQAPTTPANVAPVPTVTYRAVAASPAPQPLPVAPAPARYYPVQSYIVTAASLDHSAFTSIGHSLWTIVLGAIGAVLASWCSAPAARQEQNATMPQAGASRVP
jgi:hypothetical protein